MKIVLPEDRPKIEVPIKGGRTAEQKPWEGADSLEWTHLPTPAPYHSFETQPVVK